MLPTRLGYRSESCYIEQRQAIRYYAPPRGALSDMRV